MKFIVSAFFLVLCFWVQSQKLDSTAFEMFAPQSHFKFEEKSESSAVTQLELQPSVHLTGAFSSESNASYSAFASTRFNLKRRNIRIEISAAAGGGAMPSYMQNFIDSTNVFSGFGTARGGNGFDYALNIEGRFNWQLSKHFNVEFGRARNFWGNGYRSAVLGQNHNPYPYLKLTTKAWKFRYINLFAQHKAFSGTAENPTIRYKYASTHAVDLDISRDFTLTVFESVIWQAKDLLSNRGIELNYLNPVIFFRPVEFSQGSADNVLLGIGLRYNHLNKTIFYSQLFLDEFLFSAVRSGNGWWANKVGVQLGVRSQVNSKIEAYSEMNIARPFTYTHGSTLQNYGHMNQSLAHPLGTNFYEWTSGVEYSEEDMVLNFRMNWALYGRDRDGNNYGGNIFNSYRNPFRSYENYTAQGNVHHSYIGQLSYSKKLNDKSNLWLTAQYNWRHVRSSFTSVNEHFVQVGAALTPSKLFSRKLEENHFRFMNDF